MGRTCARNITICRPTASFPCMLATHLIEPYLKQHSRGLPRIADSLEHWPSQISLPSDSIGDLQYKEFSALHRLSNGVLGGKVGELFGPLTEHRVRLLIGVVSADVTLAASKKS